MDSGNSHNLSLKINKLLISIGSVAILYSIISAILRHYSFNFFITHPSVYIILLGLILLLLGHFFLKGILRYLHIFILTLTGVLSILSDYNQFYGIGQVVILTILLYKYGFLSIYFRTKIIIISIFFISTVEISLYRSELIGLGAEVYMYVAYFIFFLYLLYKDEIDAVIHESELLHSRDIAKLENEKIKIKSEVNKLKLKMNELDRAIEIEIRSDHKVDLNEYGLTKTEKKIVFILVTKNITNREIAEKLNVKERTVKTHLYNIYNKIGIGTRTELIGLFYSTN